LTGAANLTLTARFTSRRPDLARALDQACDVKTDPDKHFLAIRELLHLLVHAEGLKEILHVHLQCEAVLRALASRSSLHENGFVKMPLLKNDAIAMRLHVWNAAQAGNWSGNIHDHRFTFWSHVIAGRLLQRRWQETPSGEIYSRYRYTPLPTTGQHVLLYEGERSLQDAGVEPLENGSSYFLGSGTLHQTAPDEGDRLITLLIEDRLFLRPDAIVFSRKYPQSEVAINSPISSMTMCQELLETVLAII
jgi:hypothetical protein